MPEPQQDRLDPQLVRLIAVLALGVLMVMLDATIVNVGIHTLTARLHTNLSTIEWVSTGYLLGVSVATPVSGWAVDRLGGRTVWLTILVAFVVASTLSAAAWSAGSLIVFRVLQGLVGGMLAPTMMTMLARAAGPNRAGRAFGMASIPIALGPVLGPVVGGLIIAHLSWRWMFLINLPIGIVAAALAIRVVPHDPPEDRHPRPLDVLGLALLSPGFAVVTYALSQVAGGAGMGATRVVVALVLGVALLLGYVAHALRSTAPLIDLRLFARRGFTASVMTISLSGGLLFAALFLVPLYYQQVRDTGPLGAGLLLVPLGVGGFMGMPIAGKLSDQLGAKRLVPFGAALAGLMMLVFTHADGGSSKLLLAGCLFLYGFGMGFIDSPTMASVYRTVPAEAAGSATGTLYVLNQLFASLGVAVVTLQLQSGIRHGSLISAFHGAFWWLSGAAAVVFLAAFALPGRPPAPISAPSVDVQQGQPTTS